MTPKFSLKNLQLHWFSLFPIMILLIETFIFWKFRKLSFQSVCWVPIFSLNFSIEKQTVCFSRPLTAHLRMNGKVTAVPFALWTCDSPSSSCSIFDGIGHQLSLWKRLFVKWKQKCDTSVTTLEDFPSVCMTTKPSNISVRSTLVVVFFFWNIITVFCEFVFSDNCYLFAKTLCTPCYWSSLAVIALFTFLRSGKIWTVNVFF